MLQDWLLLLVPLAAYLITQAVKLAFDGIKGNLDIYHMWSMYGGMPSAHSAFVVSLGTYVGLIEGFTSALFATVVVFGILALRDAMGFRRMLGDHARRLNQLSEKSGSSEKPLIEKIGHTPFEVFVGSVFGVVIALLAHHFL